MVKPAVGVGMPLGSKSLERIVAKSFNWPETPSGRSLSCSQRTRAGGPPYLLLRRLAPCFFSAQQWFFRRGGDPSSTQRRDPADELHRNRFGEWEMDRPLS